MKFPQQWCIPTKHLTKPMYDLLLTKLISEGYYWPSQTDKCGYFDLWDFIGTNTHGDILLLDNPEHYIALHEEKRDNVLSKEWLMRYLK
jgi:hypothetical protein